MKIMKKIFFPFLILFLAFPAFAFDCSKFFEKQFVQFEYSYFADYGIEGNSVLFSGNYGIFGENYDLKTGMQFYDDAFDFSLGGNYFSAKKLNWRKAHKNVRLGLGGVYHFQSYKNICSENDFLLEAALDFVHDSGFRFTFKLGDGFKISNVYALNSDSGLITDNTLSTVIRFYKKWQSGWEAYFETASHDFFRYPLFMSPQHVFGVAYYIEDSVRAGLDFKLRIFDEIITAPMVSSFVTAISVGYYF